MGDDRRRNSVDELRARIVAQEQTGKLVVFDERNRVTVFAILHRNANAVGKKLADIDRVFCHLDGRDQSFGRDQGTGWFQLPGGEPVADHGISGDVERRDAIKEIFLARLEKGEVRFVIDHFNVGSGLFARFRAFKLNVILVRHQIRGHEDSAFRENCAERTFRDRRFLLPWPKIIIGLAGHVHPHQ